MKNKLTKAVFPVAGMGTRFLPATKASPKEMLTVVDKPLIQYAVEEAYEAGIREMIFVTGRSKRAIEDHFDMAYELETELEAAGKHALLDIVRSVQPDDMQCVYVRQARALGSKGVIDRIPVGARVYITIDIDAFCPSIAPGTGTPSHGGFLYYDVLEMMQAVAQSHEIAGIDLVEVAPDYDPTGSTSILAAQILLNTLGFIFHAKK